MKKHFGYKMQVYLNLIAILPEQMLRMRDLIARPPEDAYITRPKSCTGAARAKIAAVLPDEHHS